MKTAGEILQQKRLKQKKDLKEIAEKIKIKPAYLKAIEENNFTDLPSATFIKGFLRKYAQQLEVDADTVVAMFRRDFAEDEEGQIIPKGMLKPVQKKFSSISSNLLFPILASLTFLSFLGFQLYKFYSLPKLDIIQPINGEVYTSQVTIKGKTDPENTVTINNQKVVVGPNGEFSLDLTFPSGTHSVTIKAKNRQEKTQAAQRTFQVTH